MRGRKSKVGDTRVSANGYHYTRTAVGWELTHRLLAAKELGRPLGPDDRVAFKDGNRTNVTPENLAITEVGKTSLEKKRARLEARIEELQHQLDELNSEIDSAI